MSDTPSNAPEKLVSFVDAVLFHAAKAPHSPALGLESGVLTYGQLADAIYAATARCENAGLRPGSLAGLIIADPVWHICLIAALYRLGVASVSLAADEVAIFAAGDLGAVLHDGPPPPNFTGNAILVEPDLVHPARARHARRRKRISRARPVPRRAVVGNDGHAEADRDGFGDPLAPPGHLFVPRPFRVERPHLLRPAIALAFRFRHRVFGADLRQDGLLLQQRRNRHPGDVLLQGRSRHRVGVPAQRHRRRAGEKLRRARRLARDPGRRRADLRRAAATRARQRLRRDRLDLCLDRGRHRGLRAGRNAGRGARRRRSRFRRALGRGRGLRRREQARAAGSRRQYRASTR